MRFIVVFSLWRSTASALREGIALRDCPHFAGRRRQVRLGSDRRFRAPASMGLLRARGPAPPFRRRAIHDPSQYD
jgi:hypothetical protein